jgi:thiamine biosynthesis protein ThiS
MRSSISSSVSDLTLDIEIFLNGETKRIPEGLTVARLVASLDLGSQGLAVEYNRKILRKENWDRQLISEGDHIEVVHFVGGGSHDSFR